MPSKRTDPEGLVKLKEELIARLREVESALATHGHASAAAAVASSRNPRRAMPVRDAVLNALDDLGCLAHSREIALFLNARFGREVSPTRFGTLGKDEQTAFDGRRPRSVYLCHGLTSERFEAIKRLWARSDWPLADRIVAPTSGRVQYLKMTARLCAIAASVGDTARNPEMLRIIAADHARDLPGIDFRRGQFDLERWADVARQMLAELEPRDRERRDEAAARLEALDERQQLFGIVDVPPLVAVPKSSAHGGDPA